MAAAVTRVESDVDAIVHAWADAKLARGEQIYDIRKWSAQARQRVLENEQHQPGYIERNVRAMNKEEGTGPQAPARVPAAVALRRLYDAKVGDLTRLGVREPERIMLAVDYACGEVWRCSIEPMPPGGLGKLEDELYAAIGCDRFTGIRFPPQTNA